MNNWARRTLELVTTQNYLDELQTVYPHEDAERDVSEDTINEIRRLFSARDNAGLLDTLLDLEKFPYKDSYVGFLRRDRDAILRNPETVSRISERLYSMGIEGVVNGATAPKEANQRRGNQFGDWMRETYEAVSTEEFRRSTTGVKILNATELDARNFCNTVMGIGISKRPDLVAKAGRHYVVGEAKFLSSTGGNQGRAFDDGMHLATNSTGIAHKVFILDGIHWIERGSDQFRRIDHSTAAVFSVLLLSEYLDSIV